MSDFRLHVILIGASVHSDLGSLTFCMWVSIWTQFHLLILTETVITEPTIQKSFPGKQDRSSFCRACSLVQRWKHEGTGSEHVDKYAHFRWQ